VQVHSEARARLLSHDPSQPGGRFVWGDGVFITVKGEEIALASIWPNGGPWWLRSAVGVTRMLGSQSLRPLFRLALSGEHSVL
jgi:hypothetical protein